MQTGTNDLTCIFCGSKMCDDYDTFFDGGSAQCAKVVCSNCSASGPVELGDNRYDLSRFGWNGHGAALMSDDERQDWRTARNKYWDELLVTAKNKYLKAAPAKTEQATNTQQPAAQNTGETKDDGAAGTSCAPANAGNDGQLAGA